MALNGKLIGILGWTGLVVVLAVPSADILSSQLAPKSTLEIAADTDQVQTGSIDPVEAYEQTGKPLPSYISDAPAATTDVAETPKPTVRIVPPSGSTPLTIDTPTAPAATTEVAVIAPVAPMPYPASMRPKAPIATQPLVTQPAVTEPVPIVEEETVAEVPIVDETPVRRPPAAVEPRYITEDELAGWNRGTLADYLADEGLLADASSNASYDDGSSAEYDEDGFFLDEGPNNNRSFRSRSRRDFQDDGFFFVFPD